MKFRTFLMTLLLPAMIVEPVFGTDNDATTKLSLAGSRFAINGVPTFLVGISYYGGLGASEQQIVRDLDDIQRAGFNWVRVWATWDSFGENVSAVDEAGSGREPFLQRLQHLVAECDRRQMVADVTLARDTRDHTTTDGVHLPHAAAHRTAVRTIIDTLRNHRNWYLDLANERDVRDRRFVSVDELKTLCRLAHECDPQLLVTASFGGHDLTNSDVRDLLQSVRADFLAVHRPRHADSPQQTEQRTQDVLRIITDLRLTAPVHHQEPFRRGYARWEPTAEDFLTDLRGAMEGGAAGWCFHNGATKTSVDGQPRRSFDLRQHALIDQLDSEERQVVRWIRNLLAEGTAFRED